MKTKHFYPLIFLICLLLAVTQVSSGADFCASNETELQNHLNTATSNSQSDVIKVIQGTYSGSFSFYSLQGDDIMIQGGYTSGCSSRTVDPTNTILDATGTGSRVLEILNVNGTGGDITVEGFTIQNGTAGETDYEGNGAGLYLFSYALSGAASGDIMVTNNIIKNNNAVNLGGGIFAQSEYNDSGKSTGNITVTDNIIQDNTAAGETYASGGGIYAVSYSHAGTSSNLTVSRNLVKDNDSTYGGGLYAYSYAGETSGSITIRDNDVQNNTATGGNGGGIYAVTHAAGSDDSGIIEIQNNIIIGNATSGGANLGKGGGAFVESSCRDLSCIGGDVEFSRNTIKKNQGRNGGGVYAEAYTYDGDGGGLIFISNIINGNISERNGGGLEAITSTSTNKAGDITFVNNIISGNRTAETFSGGCMWARSVAWTSGSAGDFAFINNTITNNRSSDTGGIEIDGGNNNADFYNNIIYGNSGYDINTYNDPIVLTGYNNNTSFSTWDKGSNNINIIPEFKDPGSWDENGTPADPYDDIWLGGDFHLKNSLPYIDTGTHSAPDLPDIDF